MRIYLADGRLQVLFLEFLDNQLCIIVKRGVNTPEKMTLGKHGQYFEGKTYLGNECWLPFRVDLVSEAKCQERVFDAGVPRFMHK